MLHPEDDRHKKTRIITKNSTLSTPIGNQAPSGSNGNNPPGNLYLLTSAPLWSNIRMIAPDKDAMLQKVLSAIENLPPMPENIVKMRKICANPNSSFSDIVPIIEKDPGFCADILHMANSAYYGIPHTVESVHEAVRYIGFRHVIDFISVSFSKKAIKSQFSGIQNLNDYFAHSNSVALATKCLAKTSGKPSDVQEFYTIAGLLHDIGRLIILIASDPQFRSFIDDMAGCDLDQTEKEMNFFGIDHCQVGKKICEKWRFSDALQTAILRHHTPHIEPLCETGAFILLAHFLAMRNFPIEQVTSFYPDEINNRLGLNAAIITQAREMFFESSVSLRHGMSKSAVT